MTTAESRTCDADGYLMVPSKFSQNDYTYSLIQELEDNWRIYSVQNKDGRIIDYELVQFYKSEEYKMGGNTISPRWNYPGASQFGRRGFSIASVKWALKKYESIRQEQSAAPSAELTIPKNKEFTVKELAISTGKPYYVVYLKVKELGPKVKTLREIKNKRGKNTKVLIYQE